MFDNTQIVETKELAKAVQGLSGLLATPEQLKQKKVTERSGDIIYIAPGLISRIMTIEIYNPDRDASLVRYINGDIFKVDLKVEDLVAQLGLDSDKAL